MFSILLKTMKRIPFVLAILFIAIYLLAGRSHWFSEIFSQAEIGKKPIYSASIDLTRVGKFTWKIPRDNWVFDKYSQGEARLSIVFDRKDEIELWRYKKEHFPLRLKVNAYANTEDQFRLNRQIQNWYFKTNEPFRNKDNIVGSSWGSSTVSYLIAGIYLYSQEDTFVEIEIMTPDSELAKTNPRLKLVGDHDYAIFGHLSFFYLIRDGGLLLCFLFLATIWLKLNKRDKHNLALESTRKR